MICWYTCQKDWVEIHCIFTYLMNIFIGNMMAGQKMDNSWMEKLETTHGMKLEKFWEYLQEKQTIQEETTIKINKTISRKIAYNYRNIKRSKAAGEILFLKNVVLKSSRIYWETFLTAKIHSHYVFAYIINIYIQSWGLINGRIVVG